MCSLEMSGQGGETLPLAECRASALRCWPLAPSLLPATSAACSSLCPGIRGHAPIPCGCDPPSSCRPLQRSTDELTLSICCSGVSGWLQPPPRGHGTPTTSTPGVGLWSRRPCASHCGFAEPLLGPVLAAGCPLDASSGWDYSRAALANYRLPRGFARLNKRRCLEHG